MISWHVRLGGRSWAAAFGLLLALGARAAEPGAFYVNYAARVPTAPLVAHALSIVHPGTEVDLAAAHAAGGKVLAYLSIGEVAADAPYRAEVMRRALPFAARNEAWNSDVIALGDPRWAEFLVDELAAAAAKRGFDGFFLDTLDAADLVAPGDDARTAEARRGLVEIVRRLRAAFPRQKIVVNRGFFAWPELSALVDGVLVESLFATHDLAAKRYLPVPAGETEALLVRLREVTAAGREVYVLDYVDPADAAGARAAAERIRALGFQAFISTPALDGAMLGPLRPVARRICALFGNMTTVREDEIKWPAESFIGQRLQLPLEWMGYEVDYTRIRSAADLPTLTAEHKAILLPRFWEIPPAAEAPVVDWLLAQRAAGRKIVIFGTAPFADLDQRVRFLRALGVEGTAAVVPPPFKVEIAAKDAALFDYEAPVSPLPVGHLDLRAPAGARVLLAARAQPKDAAPVRFDAAFVCDWGGMALDPYLIFRRPDYREFWHIDLFAFLRLALGDLGAPAPDTTTRDGRRLFLSHIDGDGFSNFSRVEAGRRSAEIVRDRILKKYPLPVTVSVIEAEVRGMIRTQRSDDAPALEAIARDIFTLPHVELASHSFSHPFFWIEGDRTEAFYDEQNLELKIPYDKLDLVREIEGSVRYIDEKLAPPGRRTRVFLWSGNCRPPPEALARVRQLGLENLNGGDTIITARNRSLSAVAPRTMPWGGELQVYAPNQNENVYTNNWRGPLFGTFSHVLDTFALTETPRRLKAVNVYYHFYSGDYPASLQALETIYDWVMAQPLHAVTVSHYARLARDARATEIFAAGPERWVIASRGESRTVRLPARQAARIDLARSPGVTGWKIEGEEAYVHTDGSPAVTVALAPQPVAGARLESSSAEIAFRERGPARWRFAVEDTRPAEVVFAGFAPGAVLSAVVGGTSRELRADAAGRVALALPAQAEVRLEAGR